MPTIDVNGTTLRYRDDGPRDGPALVFSHSMLFDGRMHEPQARAFGDTHRVIRYDLRGQGDSARAPREQLDFDTQAEDAAALIEALGIAPCTYLGSSMGGFVGLRLAARRPELLNAVVAMGSSADVEGQAEAMDYVAGVFAEQGPAAVLDAVLYFMLGDTTLEDPERAELLAWVKELVASRGPEYADSAWHISHRPGILDELPSISVPTLVIAGDEDHTYPREKSEQIAALVPGARLETVPRAGHVLALENPEAANAILRDFLAGL